MSFLTNEHVPGGRFTGMSYEVQQANLQALQGGIQDQIDALDVQIARAEALRVQLAALSGSLAEHVAAPDPHPQYTTAAEVGAAIDAHEAETDPHPQYLLASEVGGGGPHTHPVSDVVGLQGALDGLEADKVETTDPRLSDARTPTAHAHTIADTTGLQTVLDAKAAAVHGHAIADTTGLQTALDAKAATTDPRLSDARTPTAHTHAIADTTGLQTALAGKANTTHAHTIADTTGLQAALDAKAAAADLTAHTGSTSNPHSVSLDQAAQVNATISRGISITASTVTGLLRIQGTPSSIVLKRSSGSVGNSLSPQSTDFYITSGCYYTGTVFLRDNPLTANASVFSIRAGFGAFWWAGNNAVNNGDTISSFNFASNVNLWNFLGEWASAVNTTSSIRGNSITVAALGALTGRGQSSTTDREVWDITQSWATSTDASRKGRAIFSIWDTAAREAIRIEASGTAPMIGFLGAPAVVRQTLGAAATDAATTQALANALRIALINLGLGT